jgi:hypothetical protein
MSTSISLPSGARSSRLALILAAASALVAAAAIMIILAVTAGGGDAATRPASAQSPPAAPDRATLYQHSIERAAPSLPSTAERFHHFR